LRPSGNTSTELLLLKRQTVVNDPWSGQISLPGGRSRIGETPLQTAKRETLEETQIDLDRCELVGAMDDVYTGNLLVRVTPFVLIAPEGTEAKIDNYEIVDSFWVALNFFSEEKNSKLYTFTRDETTIQTPSFIVLGKYVVWGMTLKIILNLLLELRES
jgi:8-oxo-dGTP pyrophosphatase MutT (NUDIX family)